MPIKLKQWHYAQAPAPWYSALSTVRLHNAHLRALCLYYNNIISGNDDPCPSRALIYSLYDQIIVSQKCSIVAKNHLAAVSEELRYFEDPDRMTWATRPDRRKYEYDCDSVEEKRWGEDVEQRSVRGLSEIASAIGVDYGSLDNDKSEKDSQSSMFTYTTTPPCSPPTPPLTPLPSRSRKPKTKDVHFAPGTLSPTRKRGLNRVRTPEEVEEEFQAANAAVTKPLDNYENQRKRNRAAEEDYYAAIETLTKRVKRLHLRLWPEAYFEDI